MMNIKHMNTFGETSIYKHVDLNVISSISELPEEMRLMYEDINPEASMASFICYCVNKDIPIRYIVARSGFTEDEIAQIVDQAKSVGLFSQLCNEFLK